MLPVLAAIMDRADTTIINSDSGAGASKKTTTA
jgi:hypothetical protein